MRSGSRVQLVFLAVGFSFLLARGAAAQGAPSQMIKIPPAPGRDIDPELRYQRDPAAARTAQMELAARNEKRRQLLLWAAKALVATSERAEKAASAPEDHASQAELVADAKKVEALAKNLAAAMKAQ